jgi:hypothetical protein
MNQDKDYTAYQPEFYENTPSQNNNTYTSQTIRACNTAPMTTAQYLGALFLGIIPLAGFIIYIVWAFSNDININKRNFARGMLIFFLILQAVIGILCFILIVVSVLFLGSVTTDPNVLM